MKLRRLLTLLLVTTVFQSMARADEADGRLKRIKEAGTIVISHGETAMPFSYVDKNGPLGFGVDISQRIADAVKAHLGLKDLRIRWNPVTLSTRFPMIVSNTVDMECVTTTNTLARQKMVAFSNTLFISEEGIATRRDSGINDYADLAGKRVAVTRGTSTERNLQARGLNITLVSERNNRRAMAALAEKRADAYVAAGSIIAGELARLPDASAFTIVGSGGYKEAFGCMLPKDDPAFKKVVDEAIAALMASGEMERLYNKWFMNPIPPFGRRINMPLTDDNRQLFLAPNDRALE